MNISVLGGLNLHPIARGAKILKPRLILPEAWPAQKMFHLHLFKSRSVRKCLYMEAIVLCVEMILDMCFDG